MLKRIVSFALLVFALPLLAQTPVPQEVSEMKMTFSLPNQEWKLLSKKVMKNKHIVYRYERNPIAGKSVKSIPAVSIIVEPRPAEQTITTYSTARLSTIMKQKNFKEQKTFTNSDGMLKLPYAIGYKCFYDDATGVNHTLYVIHSLKDGKGMQIWLDITTEAFPLYEEEITSMIRSFQYK